MPPSLSAGGSTTISPYYGYGALAAGALATAAAPRSRAGQAFGSAASGAMTGASIGSMIPVIGTGIGALIGGGIGLLTGALSESPEEQRQRRITQYRAQLKRIKGEETKALAESVARTTEGLQRRFGRSAARRALAQGRLGDVEEVTAPITGEIANRAADVRTQAMGDLESRYSQAELNLEQGIFEAPLEPTAVDYLQAIAPAAVDFAGTQRQGQQFNALLQSQEDDKKFYRDLYQKEFGGTTTPVSTPEAQRESLGQLRLPEATSISNVVDANFQDIPNQFDLTNPGNRRNLLRRRIG